MPLRCSKCWSSKFNVDIHYTTATLTCKDCKLVAEIPLKKGLYHWVRQYGKVR